MAQAFSAFLKQKKRIKISSINPSNNGIPYEETFFWLADSTICNECFLKNTIVQMLVANDHKLYFYTHFSEEKQHNDIDVN